MCILPYMFRIFAWLVSAVLLLTLSRESMANGRFPSAGYVVVGPGEASDVMVIRTTFGVLRSTDSGRSWSWVCEESVDAVGMFDPTMAIGFDRTTTLALPGGLSVSSDGCTWTRPVSTPRLPVVDVANDATGRTIVAAVGPSGVNDALLRSDDGGQTWRMTTTLPGYFLETVEVAPRAPMRVYVSAFVTGPEPVLLRSDDGGSVFRETTRDFAGAQSAWIAGVDATNPDIVYVRGQRPGGVGTLLVRSVDGGRTFQRLAETTGVMRAFALSDDGNTVWYGSSDRAEGLRRSVRGGEFIRVGEQPSVQCLRYHGGLLYVCADEALDGYALGCSNDLGDHIVPILSLRSLEDRSACGAESSVGSRCPALWPAQRRTLRAIDAGVVSERLPHTDAGVSDSTVRWFDVVTVESGHLPGPPQRPGTCGCRLSSPTQNIHWETTALVYWYARVRRRARARRALQVAQHLQERQKK
jgi:hypothetical protein